MMFDHEQSEKAQGRRTRFAMTRRNVSFTLLLIGAAVGLSVYFAVSNRKEENSNKSLSALDDGNEKNPVESSPVKAPARSPTSPPRVRAPASSSTSTTARPVSSPPVASPPVASPVASPPNSATTTEPPTLSPSTAEPTVAPTSSPTNTQTITSRPTITFTEFVATQNAEVTLHEGSALDNTIPYYHCSGGGDSLSHIVLLHGASFTKEDWERTGVLDLFCAWENVAVTALDLPVSAKRDELRDLLQALPTDLAATAGTLNLPRVVAAIVTPSASGSTMIDWLTSTDDSNNASTLHAMVQLWVPVACGSVLTADEDLLTAGLISTSDVAWPILAIHGDRDSSRSSDKLKELAPDTTTVVELPGGHAVYLQAQEDFVETVLDSIATNRRQRSSQ